LIRAIDHVQLAMPRGGEALARKFYEDLLGLTEVTKPAALVGNGGCWFGTGDVRLHLGIEDEFRPAKKAHPGLLVSEFDELIIRLRGAGIEVRENYEKADVVRAFISDPFGNRIELIKL